MVTASEKSLETATFAGGCFWCTESDCKRLDGVTQVTSGYAGGTYDTATYAHVSTGKTRHREAIQLQYDPAIISYRELVAYYFKHIDPSDAGGQFHDRGFQYTTAIYTHSPQQAQIANDVKAILEERTGVSFATKIEPFTTFYPAEDYHQDYSEKKPSHYKRYRTASGRDQKIREFWEKAEPSEDGAACSLGVPPSASNWESYKKPDSSKLKHNLTPMEYYVTQKEGTEPAFDNKYWNHKEAGIYVDAVSGEPLFSSKDKYDSKTGWPSFSKPIDADHVVFKQDHKFGMERIEVRSKYGDSHLGHVFDDPRSPTGKRYCINSAALRFIPEKEQGKK